MCGATYAAATGVVKERRAEAVGRAHATAYRAHPPGPVSVARHRNWAGCPPRGRAGGGAGGAVSRREDSKENEMPFVTVRRLVAGFVIACIVLVGAPAMAEPPTSAPEDIQYLLDAIGRSGCE